MLLLTLMCFCVPVIWCKSFPPISQTLNTKIVNGERATLRQFPWQVALYGYYGTINYGFCGGSIINERWIVTAAHCLYYNGFKATVVQIYTGSLHRYVGDISTAYTIIPHEHYNPTTLSNDIGLVKLNEPLTLSGTTAIITLSNKHLDDGITVTVSGWGRDESELPSDELKYITLQTISNEKCNETFPYVLPEVVCAQFGLKSVCNGDSGGPVVIDVDSDPRLVAVVSFVSVQGCGKGLPSGYTRIEPHLDWIKKHSGISGRGGLSKILIVLTMMLLLL